MPTKLNILNCPSFQTLLSQSTLIGSSSWLLTFTVVEAGDKKSKPVEEKWYIWMLGRSWDMMARDGEVVEGALLRREPCVYGFIGRDHSGQLGAGGKFRLPRWYVGQINVRTRKGYCEMFEQKEVLVSPIMQLLFSTDHPMVSDKK